LLSRIQLRFGRDLPLRSLFDANTLQAMAALLDGQQGAASNNLVCLRAPAQSQSQSQSQSESAPLFLLHAGDGEIGYARELAQHLPASLPVYGLVASGLAEGEAVASSVAQMAAQYVQLMRSVQPQGPYRIAGWSAGGLIAYEMARQLMQVQQKVSFLGLLDTAVHQQEAAALDLAAGVTATLAPGQRLTAAQVLLKRMLRAQHLHQFPDAACIAQLREQAGQDDLAGMLQTLVAAGLMPPEMQASQLARYLAVNEAIEVAVKEYVVQDLPLAMTLFSAIGEAREDRALGWQGRVAALRVVMVAGSHQTMVLAGQVAALARAMAESASPV
jgi:thioesterase domain-containing protein